MKYSFIKYLDGNDRVVCRVEDKANKVVIQHLPEKETRHAWAALEELAEDRAHAG